MINPDDRSTGLQGAAKMDNLPKCICSWPNCRGFQKVYREAQHPVFDGVIKLRFVKNHPASQALKDSIDRVLQVPEAKANDWKPGKREGQFIIRYYIARHHYTERHIQKYLGDPQNFSFLKPFSVHGAKKYLYTVDPNETFQFAEAQQQTEALYLQCPNVPKEVVQVSVNELTGDDDTPKEQAPPSSVAAVEQPVAASPKKAAAAAPQPKPEKKDSLTVSTTRSSSQQQQQQLRTTEEENRKLKETVEYMQSQIFLLHDMLRQLQENHLPATSAESVKSGARSVSHRQQRGSGRSARSGAIPREINFGDDGTDDWTEYQDDQTESARGQYEEDDDETFRSSYRTVQRRNSNGTQATSGAVSIKSASKSVTTLPREMQFNEDEDDSDSHPSLEEEAYENRSVCSTVFSARSSSRRESRSSVRPSMASPGPVEDTNNRKPSRRTSIGSQSVKSNSKSVTSAAGTYDVQAMDVTDPYGEKGTYTGSISNSTGMPHGYGRLEYDRAGRWYEGDWKHGRWTGQGRLSNGDGDFYQGGLKNDHKHGMGIMKFADGRTFEGEYINGQMIEGRMTYQDGSTYSGSWVDGMRHGRGKCVFTDDSVYEGEFREGEFSGQGKMAWSDGGWYQGEWWNGEMHGKGKEVRPDGSIRHDGEWCRGQPIRR